MPARKKTGGKENPSKKKEVSPHQPSAIGNPMVTETALSTAGGGEALLSPPQKVKQHAGTYKPRGRRSPPSAPSPIQQTTKAGKKLIAEHRDGRSRSLPTVTYIQMQPRVSIPGTALQSWRTSPEQGEQECLWHPAKQQSMEDLVSQVQLSSR